ncbi:hypothetical protein BXU08_11380 [Sphingomonas sp. LM7]|nr:hypothetical protein BXU08_11380 [Sphingomonas sp. LM7]
MAGAATLFVALAQPAEARRRFRLGGFGSSSYSEKIDKVYDLPDSDTYLHDGQYYDLGAFYQVRGGTEMRPATPSFVLYNGERYVKLDESQLALIKDDLGMDPTAAYRARAAIEAPVRAKSPNEIERRDGESMAEFRARARGMAARGNMPSDSESGTPARGGLIALLVLPVLVIGGIFIFWLRRFLRRRVARVIAATGDTGPGMEVHAASFDQRIASRLRELEGGQGQPAAAMPAPRTFGRKLA